MNRLECIQSMVHKCETAADIGTDHGYLPYMLLSENICNKIIATDLNKGPLNKAIEYLKNTNYYNQCDFRLGSGLSVLGENEADVIIIAGMGGELISDIINNNKSVAQNAMELILQPMTKIEKLRYYLITNGFKITDEKLVKEFNHYYFIIKSCAGEQSYDDEIYYEMSKILIEKKDTLMIEYIEKILSQNQEIINNLEKIENYLYHDKIKILKNKNEKIRELI